MKPKIGHAVIGGLAGTTAMTMMLYLIAPMLGVRMDIAAGLGQMLGGSWTLGLMMHFINGTIIFSLIYSLLLYRFLPGGPVSKGVLWGLALWVVAQLVVVPMMGGGIFSSKMGGIMAAMGSLMNHLVYGGLLGWIAGPKGLSTHQRVHPEAA